MSVPQRPIHVMLMLFVITRQDPIIVPVIVGILGMDKRALVNIIHLMSDPEGNSFVLLFVHVHYYTYALYRPV